MAYRFDAETSQGILPRHQMGAIDVYMDADTAPDGALVVAENGAGAADQPAVSDFVYPVSIRILVACIGRGDACPMERSLPQSYLV